MIGNTSGVQADLHSGDSVDCVYRWRQKRVEMVACAVTSMGQSSLNLAPRRGHLNAKIDPKCHIARCDSLPSVFYGNVRPPSSE